MEFRTDNNRNPAAFTTDLAKQGQLIEGTDYEVGDSFVVGNQTYHTARILGDPLDTTIKLIDRVGFYTVMPHQRWTYMAIPFQLWQSLTLRQKQYTIGVMYENEGGIAMKSLFPTLPV